MRNHTHAVPRPLTWLALLVLVLGACQSAAPAPSQPGPAAAATQPPAKAPAASAAPQASGAGSGGQLTILTKQEPDTMDPHQTQSRYASIVINAMFDPLVWMDAKQQLQPGLATSWELSPDKLSWTFKLRKDVKFHDGTPFNAQAAKFNFDRMVDPAIKSVGAGVLIGPYKSTEVIDDYTVRVNFTQPNGAFLNTLADPYGWLAMVSPTAAQKYGKDFNLHPVGTGPFMFEDYKPQASVTLKQNPDYNWGPAFAPNKGRAKLDRIIFRFVAEDSTRLAALETGEADVIMEVPPLEVQNMKTNSKVKLQSSVVPGVPVVAIMNAKKPPLDDVRVRQALNYAVDQERMVNTVFDGQWGAVHNILAPNTWSYDEQSAKMYSYNPDKAKQLLDQAGWKVGADGIRAKDGTRLEVLYLALFAPPYDPGEALQAQLKDVGIDMKYQVLEGAQHRAASRRGDHNLAWTRFVSIDPSVLDTYFSSQNIGTGFNYTQVADKELDDLLAQGRAETDPAKRKDIYVQLQRKIMEKALILPLHMTVMITAQKVQVDGFELGPGGFMPWNYNNWSVKK